MSSPTQRSLQHLRKRGYQADVVEKWIPFTKQRKDLFGCIDIVAAGNGHVLGVQATSYSGGGAAARVAKSLSMPGLIEWLLGGCLFEVWAWKKRGKQWLVSRKRITVTEVNGRPELCESDWSDPE